MGLHGCCSPANVNISMLIVLGLLCSTSPVLGSRLGGNETDRLALLDIKAKITYDPLQVMSSWNDSTHFCHWQGITCSRRHQRVTALDLQSKQLVGPISPHVGNMSFLATLTLANNTFNHEIPQEIGLLFRLQTLRLENNSFTGKIPVNLSYCLRLTYLSFDGNKLEGEIPSQLGMSLKKLEVLFLRSNNLTGEIPPSFWNLTSLVALAMSENNLQGEIPNTFGQSTNLSYIALGANNLSGIIPPSIYNLSSLYHIALPVNKIRGSLPHDMFLSLPNLRLLYIHTNLMSGTVPVSISNASYLQVISISRNRFTGKVSSLGNLHSLEGLGMHLNNLGNGETNDLDFLTSLVNCTTLELVSLSGNSFGGELPENIGNFSTKLRSIGLALNKIIGRIPAGIGNLINLDVISLEHNQLVEGIPDSLGSLRNLKYLYVNGNKLSGEIPHSLGNLTLLYGLNLEWNDLHGSIPSILGNCEFLIMLYLSHNKLNGTIPIEVISLSSLSIQLDLSHNYLSGSLPFEVGRLINIGYFDVSENKLSGKLPNSLGNCLKLENLYLQGNLFEGTIPFSLSSLRGIQYLDLSRNKFSGGIPEYFENLTSLKSLNISYNAFEGEVPSEGVFKNTSAISIAGNKNLCGGLPELQLPICEGNESNGGELSLMVKLIISIVGGFLGLTLVLSLGIFYSHRKRRSCPSSIPSFDSSFLKLSYGQLFKATNGFSSTNLIGVGAFGSVYKGILDPDRIHIAVKVLNLQHRGASKSFMIECEALRNLRHRNLVKIITACSSIDSRGNDFKALVYEFMVNGSLEEWLHPIAPIDRIVIPNHLRFSQRLNIVFDIGCALEYLHNGCQEPVIHCDLKPSNVLIDHDMTARLGDFGLARFPLEVIYLSSSNKTSSLGIRGSIGYAAPEYGMGSEVSTSGDVYSYGIIILELFTGKRPTDEIFTNGLSLHSLAKTALPERVMKIVDPILLDHLLEEKEDEEEEEEDDEEKGIVENARTKKTNSTCNIKECLISIFRIGVNCTMKSPRERMGINDVVKELHWVKETLHGSGRHGDHVQFNE